jgi:hypothetical protein
MVIRIDQSLPCASYRYGTSGGSECGQRAVAGFITPVDGGAWELLPACAAHLQEARDLTRYNAMDADALLQDRRPAESTLVARSAAIG